MVARFRRAADRTSRRVRLFRFPGDQGPARGRGLHGAGQSEHRDHPDEPRARRPHLSRCRDPGVRREDHRQGGRRCHRVSFGGRPALNCGLALHDSGVLAKHGIQVLGRPSRRFAIRGSEPVHRGAGRIGVKTARSRVPYARFGAQARFRGNRAAGHAARGYALGGKGSGIVRRDADMEVALAARVLRGVTQVPWRNPSRGGKKSSTKWCGMPATTA